VLKDAKSFLLANMYKSVCENEKYASIRKRYVASFLLAMS
jgi:DNA mismatch repair protein MSH4